MARYRRRRRRRYGDPVISMPSFGNVREYNPLGQTVNSTDVAVGAFIGLGGGGLVNYALRKVWPTAPIPPQYLGAVTAFGAGVGAYTLFRKKSQARAKGYLVGAVIAGAVPLVWGMVKGALPATVSTYFGDPVIAMPSFGSLITRTPPAYRGLITRVPPPAIPAVGRRMLRA